jgi:hypothetical protein
MVSMALPSQSKVVDPASALASLVPMIMNGLTEMKVIIKLSVALIGHQTSS